MLTYDTGAASSLEVMSGKAAYMAQQTVQNLGVRQPNNSMVLYYAERIDQKIAEAETQAVLPKLRERRLKDSPTPRRTLDELDAALRADIVPLAELLLGKPTHRSSSEFRWGSKGSFVVYLRRGRGMWKDFESGEAGSPLQLIVRARGGAMRDAIEWAYRWTGIDPNEPEPFVRQEKPTKGPDEDDEKYRLKRLADAQRMWKASVPLDGTLGERYLVETRGVPRRLFGWPEAFRYHAESKSLIVGLSDAAGEVRAVQQVMLDDNARKDPNVRVAKPTTGRMEGLVVRLPGPAVGPLVLAEGPETAISVWAATGYEVWIAVGGVGRASGLLPKGRRIIVAQDDDPVGAPGWLAVMKKMREWKAEGLDVTAARPWQHSRGDKSDFNDLLRQSGAAAVRARFREENVVRLDPTDMPQNGAVVRPETHPALLRLLEIKPGQSLSEKEIAHLMNATTIYGALIPGKTYDSYKEKHSDGSVHSTPIGYFDLTWNCHKSASLAWAFAVSERQRDVVLRAHREAVEASMVYAEKIIGVIRKGDGGRKGKLPGHITYVRFDHYTSRPTIDTIETDVDGTKRTVSHKVQMPGDPHLHSHCIIPNIVLGDDGALGSLVGNELRGNVKQLGAYFQAQFATRLRKYGGIEVDVDPDTKTARIVAIPSAACRALSKRTHKSEIVAREFAATHGLDWDTMTPEQRTRLVHKSAGITKQRKAADAKIDFDSWMAQADAVSWKPASVLRPGEELGLPSLADRIEGAYAASLPWLDQAFRRRAVLTEDDIRTIATQGLIATGIHDWRDIDRVTKMYRERGVLHNERLTNLVWAPDPLNRWHMSITTELHEAEETELKGLVQEAFIDQRGANRLTARELKQHADASGLVFSTAEGREQYNAAERIANGGRFALVIGVPGSGKSSVLKPLVAGWQAAGINVVGLALAWKQAEALKEAGISYGKAIDAFLMRPHEAKLTDKSVVVIDEIGQVCTHHLLQLLRLQKAVGFAIVTLGDPRQCQSIEAGPVIDLLREALGDHNVPKLMKIIRQNSDREKQIAKLFRDGEAAEAIAMKRQDGTALAVPGSYSDVVKHVAQMWSDLTQAQAHDKNYRLTIMTPTNAEAHDISAAIREVRRARGEIGPDLKTIRATDQHARAMYDLPLAVGDKVRLFNRINAAFTTGSHGNLGHNGSVLTVNDVTDKEIHLMDKFGRVGRVQWSTLMESGSIRLAYGDVLTIDAGQGMTGTEHIDAMPGGSSAISVFKATVTESRHRERSFMVVSDIGERRQIIARRPTGDEHPITEDDVWSNVARNLSRGTAQESATAMIARLENIKRSTAIIVEDTRRLEQIRPARWPRQQLRNVIAQAFNQMAQTVKMSITH